MGSASSKAAAATVARARPVDWRTASAAADAASAADAAAGAQLNRALAGAVRGEVVREAGKDAAPPPRLAPRGGEGRLDARALAALVAAPAADRGGAVAAAVAASGADRGDVEALLAHAAPPVKVGRGGGGEDDGRAFDV